MVVCFLFVCVLNVGLVVYGLLLRVWLFALCLFDYLALWFFACLVVFADNSVGV